jgi:hypothetical protein
MSFMIIIVAIIAIMIFFVMPQVAKFRATLGIDAMIEARSTSFLSALRLRILGLKTPIINSIAMAWSFFLAEGTNLSGFAWEQIVSREHAIWIAMALWFGSLWSHFSGLNAAAATPPVISPLPGAVVKP